MAKQTKPPFLYGMTEEEAIAYIKGRILQHKTTNRSKGWSEEDLLIRHQIILKMLGEGTPRIDVSRHLMNLWDISDSLSRLYVTEALKYLTEATDDYRDYVRQTQVGKLEKLIQECKEQHKMKEAMMGMEQLNKIYGIYDNTQKVELKTEEPIKFEFGK